MLVFNTQIYILNKNLEVQELSKFIFFAKIFEIARTSIANFTTVLVPKIIKTEYEESTNSLIVLYKNSLKRVAVLLCLVGLFLMIFGRDLFMVWTKYQIQFDSNLFYLFLVYNILILIDNVSALYLSALKFNKLPTIVSILQGSIVVFSSFLLAGRYGIIGVIFSSIAALVLTNLFFNPFYLLKKLKFENSF
jgi:O-antigen/teichoic acid export membrane protein